MDFWHFILIAIIVLIAWVLVEISVKYVKAMQSNEELKSATFKLHDELQGLREERWNGEKNKRKKRV
jgi:archaellum component FlaF (FlaF/FlaG flagellin family)